MANEIAKAEPIMTNLALWSEGMVSTLEHEYATCGIPFTEYERRCGAAAMTAIYELVVTSGVNMAEIDTSNLHDVLRFCASNRLNCNAVPSECYFKLVNKKVGNQWVKQVECSVMGCGYESMLRNFGIGVETVFPSWIVCEGDDFVPPRHKGIEVAPPEWTSNGRSQKVMKVVIPIRMKGGEVIYKMADRESVKTNLMAHIRNNLLSETFGLAENRFKATAEQKTEIESRKAFIMAEVRKCETLDEMLKCEVAQPYISMAWLDSPESMIARKLINNICRTVGKDMNQIAKNSYTIVADETYKDVSAEIAEEANSEAFVMPEMP